MASRWSAVSVHGNRASNSRSQSESSGVGVAGPAAALGVEVDELAGELLRGAAGAGLERLPALPAELGQRRVAAARADVAGDLRELVDREEDAVGAGVLELEVVAGDAADGLRVEAPEAGQPVVLVDDDVARAQVGERAQRAATAAAGVLARGALRPAAAEEAVLGEHRQAEPGGDEAVAQRGRGEAQLLRLGRAGALDRVLVLPAGPQAREVVAPPARPRRGGARSRPSGSPSGGASRARARPP